MTDIPSAIENSSYNVLVVGYDNDGNLIYIDPEIGELQEAPDFFFEQKYIMYFR